MTRPTMRTSDTAMYPQSVGAVSMAKSAATLLRRFHARANAMMNLLVAAAPAPKLHATSTISVVAVGTVIFIATVDSGTKRERIIDDDEVTSKYSRHA
jgi:hypothetical protein